MCAKERTLKLEKYSQKPRTQRTTIQREKQDQNARQGIRGRWSRWEIGKDYKFLFRKKKKEEESLSPTSIKNNNNPYTLQQSPLQLKTSHAYSVSAAVLPQAM